MSEANAIERSQSPVTIESLAEDLRKLGVRPGMVLLVHSSMSALGWVCGGAVAVVEALMRILTRDGTLVMPTHSSQLSDPSNWRNPPVPESWRKVIRNSMPPFDPLTTPTRGMGTIPEVFRTMPDVMRSNHPTCSMSAWGSSARETVSVHALADPHGDESPLGRINALDGSVLLLGVGHAANTSIHLAERRVFANAQARVQTGAPVLLSDGRRWVPYEEPEVDSGDFVRLGEGYEAVSPHVRLGRAGWASARLMPQRDLVDFSVKWLRKNRDSFGRVLRE